jgi:hypothetical protein
MSPKLYSCHICGEGLGMETQLISHLKLHEISTLNRPCWDCDVREALPNERYCKECEDKTQFISDFYEQFKD